MQYEDNEPTDRSGPERLEPCPLKDLMLQGYGQRADLMKIIGRCVEDAARLFPTNPDARDRHVVAYVRGWFASSDHPQ